MNFFKNMPLDIVNLLADKYLTQKEQFFLNWAMNYPMFRRITKVEIEQAAQCERDNKNDEEYYNQYNDDTFYSKYNH